MAESVRGSYKMLPGAGHYPHAEMPEQTGALMLAFLETIRESAYHAA